METPSDPGAGAASPRPAPRTIRHAIRDQEVLWADFLAMSRSVVDSLAKGVEAICDGRLDVIPEVKKAEQESDREEVRIEQECLRILALYEPVASDLRRLATMLKVSRDWERVADLAARIARRARKLTRRSDGVAVPDDLKALAREVLVQVRSSYDALAARDARLARDLIQKGRAIDARFRTHRKSLKQELGRDPGRLKAWLQLLGTARNLERASDHATDIAQTIIYLEEGIIVRHQIESSAP
ncbi:MAG: phosphate signaling complex protein PhoU [Isosphaeraceae bacterium]